MTGLFRIALFEPRMTPGDNLTNELNRVTTSLCVRACWLGRLLAPGAERNMNLNDRPGAETLLSHAMG